MRIIDLILLLNDFKKNNRIFIESSPRNLAVIDIKASDERIYLETSEEMRGLKNWELIIMLNKREYYEYPVFFETKKNHQQLFGFRVVDDRILLG